MDIQYTHISQEAAQGAINALPMSGTVAKSAFDDIIDVGVIHIDKNLEPERAKLIKLINAANMMTVRKLLKTFNAE